MLDNSTIKWTHGWLNDCIQKVLINGITSAWRKHQMPQGSVLGLGYFNILSITAMKKLRCFSGLQIIQNWEMRKDT